DALRRPRRLPALPAAAVLPLCPRGAPRWARAAGGGGGELGGRRGRVWAVVGRFANERVFQRPGTPLAAFSSSKHGHQCSFVLRPCDRRPWLAETCAPTSETDHLGIPVAPPCDGVDVRRVRSFASQPKPCPGPTGAPAVSAVGPEGGEVA